LGGINVVIGDSKEKKILTPKKSPTSEEWKRPEGGQKRGGRGKEEKRKNASKAG